MVTIEELQASEPDPSSLRHWLLPVDRGIQSWPRVDLGADDARRVLDGQPLDMPAAVAAGVSPLRIYGPGGHFLGIAERDELGRLAPRRLIANRPVPGTVA
jgi:tRNA pseudouridine55 synthase